jgi:carboxylesterase type B
LQQALQKATTYNATTEIYTFSNIRYAADPGGELRFRAPQAPPINRSSIQDGSGIKMCPQGFPNWQVAAFTPIGEFASGKVPFSIKAWERSFNETVEAPDFNANTSEDCLFLDVYVPGKVLRESKLENAPVLVYVSCSHLTTTHPSEWHYVFHVPFARYPFADVNFVHKAKC